MNDEQEPQAPAALRGYRLDCEPQRDLWPDIAARIAPRRRRAANGWFGLAAAACLALAVGLSLLPQAQLPSTVPAPLLAPHAAANDSRALIKANLQITRSSQQQIRKALEQDPDSAALQRLLQTTEDRGEELHRLLAQST